MGKSLLMSTISKKKNGALGERQVGKGVIRSSYGSPGEGWRGLLPESLRKGGGELSWNIWGQAGALWLDISLNTKGWELNLVWGEKQEFSVGLNRFRFGYISVKLFSENPFNISLPDSKTFAVSSPEFSHCMWKYVIWRINFIFFANEVRIIFFFLV